MALILTIYPTADSNSFITLAEADAINDYNVDAPLWQQQSDDEKMRLLVKAYNAIVSLEGIELPVAPDPIPGCLGPVQAETALNYLVNEFVFNDRRIKTEKTGVLSTTYQDVDLLEPDTFTETSVDCLKSYGALQPNAVGAVGSIRKTRF